MQENRFAFSHILVHYSEIALKGKNRRFFEEALVRSLEGALGGLGARSVKRLFGRLVVDLEDGASWEEARRRLESIVGIANFEPAVRAPLSLEEIERTVGELIDGRSPATFAVATRRANKRFPLNSMEVNREVGRFVVERTGWKVSIDRPELPIYIFLLDRHAYIALDRFRGAGGLPFGCSGRVACLLSGGIDSPVAAYRMIRRGCRPVFVHFHSAPHTSAASQDKVRDLADHLMRYYPPTRIYFVPFAELQRRIVAGTPAPYRVILYRRFMVRAAEEIARRERASALVTGESLGQVASQTLENLATIDRAAAMPIIRPLIGCDKQEIVEQAKRLGTFGTSIEPHDDCCSFLMPRHPATFSAPPEIEAAEAMFDVGAEVRRLVEGAEVEEVGGGGIRRAGRTPGAAAG